MVGGELQEPPEALLSLPGPAAAGVDQPQPVVGLGVVRADREQAQELPLGVLPAVGLEALLRPLGE